MDTDKKADPSEAAGPSPAAPTSSSRRRLLQAGLGASPVLLTIVSEPVRAFTRTQSIPCRSASAFASIAAAAHANVTTSANTQQSCSGLGPASWNTLSTWPVAKTTLFSSVFSGAYSLRVKSGNSSITNASPTFSDILSNPPANTTYSDSENLARNFVAAYLNFKDSKTPAAVVTDLQLQNMWTKVLANSYSPTAGTAPWSVSDVNGWLSQTFSAA